MAMMPYGGDWTFRKAASKASTAYSVGNLLQNDGTDNIRATATSTIHVGICMEDKESSDTSTTPLTIAVPRDVNATFIADVSGTLTKAMEGRFFDLIDSNTVNQAASAVDAVQLVQFISATKGVFALNTFGGFRDAV